MTLQHFLQKLMIETVANGTLLLEDHGRSLRFKLINADCFVSGPLNCRRDWADPFGRPGLMPLIDEVKFNGGETFTAKPLASHSDFMEDVYDVLQERLSPQKLYTFDQKQGWMLTSFSSKPLRHTG